MELFKLAWLYAALMVGAVAVHNQGLCADDLRRVECNSWKTWNTERYCIERGCCWNNVTSKCYYKAPQTQVIRKVHVIQGCHFDAGFMLPIKDIINLWFYTFFPMAYQVGSALDVNATSQSSPRLKFTAQSWLVELFLHCKNSSAYAREGVICPNNEQLTLFKTAVSKGYITWHAFPYNGEAEMMDPSFFSFGVALTHKVDDELGQKRKHVLSQRDVPGITRSVIPLLVPLNVSTISVGSNDGSAPPNVPQAFVWRDDDSGLSMNVLFLQGGYAGHHSNTTFTAVTAIPGSSDVMVLMWRGDNRGPPQVEEVLFDWQQLKMQFPGAEIVSSTFDEFAATMAPPGSASTLPVITREMGDTWIYGCPSDPLKVASTHLLSRMRRRCLLSGECQLSDHRVWDFSVYGLKNFEHTWGGDQKRAIPDYVSSNWTNADFAGLQQTRAFQAYQDTWITQKRMGIQDAVEALADHPLAGTLQRALQLLVPSPVNLQGWQVVTDLAREIKLGDGIRVMLNSSSGSLVSLNEHVGPMALLSYQTYGNEQYDDFKHNYNYDGGSYLAKDFVKLNLPTNINGSSTTPTLKKAYLKDNCLIVLVTWQLELHLYSGAPRNATITYCAESRQSFLGKYGEQPLHGDGNQMDQLLSIEIVLWNKSATRLPESMFVSFAGPPHEQQCRVVKLGSRVKVDDVLTGGSQHLHSVEAVEWWSLKNNRSSMLFAVAPLDSSIVSLDVLSAFPTPIVRSQAKVIGQQAHFCVWNNLWNTNYIMWYPYESVGRNVQTRFLLQP